MYRSFNRTLEAYKALNPEKYTSLEMICYADLMSDKLIPYARDLNETQGMSLTEDLIFTKCSRFMACSYRKSSNRPVLSTNRQGGIMKKGLLIGFIIGLISGYTWHYNATNNLKEICKDDTMVMLDGKIPAQLFEVNFEKSQIKKLLYVTIVKTKY